MVSEASVNKAFKNVDEEIAEIMKYSDEVEGMSLEGTATSRIKLIKHVRKFQSDRQELFKQMQHLRAEKLSYQRRENKAEQDLYELLQNPGFSLEEVADKLELSFEKFMKVYNFHVAYVYSYPGFTTLYTHIGKRLRLFKEVNRVSKGLFANGKFSKENYELINSEIEVLRHKYHDLEESLKVLDKLFAEFNNLQSIVYNQTGQLNMLQDKYERAPGIAGFFGKKILVVKGVDIDKISSENLSSQVKAGKMKLGHADERRVNIMITASKTLHKVKVPVIRDRRSILRKELLHISNSEKNVWDILDMAHKALKKAKRRTKLAKAA